MALPVKTLNQTHHEYDGDRLMEYKALYEGEQRWEALKQRWLPQHSEEGPKTYSERLKRASYENNAGPIADLLAGGMFTRPPIIQNVDSAWLEDFTDDVDKKGTDLDSWLQDLLLCAMEGRRAYGWVNADLLVEGISQAQQEANGGANPFLVKLEAINVIDWDHDEMGRLTWLMHRGMDSVRNSIASERLKRITWTYIDGEVIRQWRWVAAKAGEDQEPKEDDEIAELPTIVHGFGELPVAELCLKKSMHIMGKLRHPAVTLLRSQNDLDWGLHRGAHALLWIRSKWDTDKPNLAPGAYFQLRRDKDGMDEMGYAEPPGQSLELLAKRVTQQREGLFRVVHQMAQSADGNATRAQMSAASKEMDWRATEIVLSAYADAFRPFVSEVVRLVTIAMDGPEKAQMPTIDGLEGWHQEDLLPWLTAASLSVRGLAMSETYHRAVAKAEIRRVLPHAAEEVLKTIEDEIDKADVDLEMWKLIQIGGPDPSDIVPRDQDGDGVIDEP